MSVALRKLVFLSYSLSLDYYRWCIFAGKVHGSTNEFYWKIRRVLQGITPSENRTAKDLFDAGAKYHTVGNVPYIR